MGFWGIEVKSGKPHPYHSDNVPGTLHITQATLGLGSSSERSILQCSVGHKNPIFLCSLLPKKNECCPLSLEFGDEGDVVAFSVIGPRSIHLSGYFVADDGDHLRDEYDSYLSDSSGEDLAEMDSDDSSDYDTEDEYGDFDDDDDDDDGDFDGLHFLNSSASKSGVVIEEIVDDEKPTNGKVDCTREKKKKQSSDYEGKSNSEHQLVVRKATGEPVLESEDEDGFPVSASHTEAQGTDKKRKVKSTVEDDPQERKKKKKKQKEKATDNINGQSEGKIQLQEVQINDKIQISPVENEADQKPSSDKAVDTDTNSIPSENFSEKKKKKKKKKKNQESEGGASANQTVSASGDKNASTSKTEEKQTAVKPSQVRTFPNGLVIEELVMGKPDGKWASRGKQVSVRYIGRLKKNGKIFDSNVGKAPFKFRLGVGQVIKGWDVGVEGMRIGDKRKLMIPPSMGYGSQGAGGKIPPNSWLEFDVELMDVR